MAISEGEWNMYTAAIALGPHKAHLLKMVELSILEQILRSCVCFFLISPFPLPVSLARDPTYGPTQGFSLFYLNFDSLFGDQPLGFWTPLRDNLDCNRSYIVYS